MRLQSKFNEPGKALIGRGRQENRRVCTAAHALLSENLIDECWLFVNPVLLGQGIPVFKGIHTKQRLKLLNTHVFSSGVVCLHHECKPEN